jgi:hypothetical protein
MEMNFKDSTFPRHIPIAYNNISFSPVVPGLHVSSCVSSNDSFLKSVTQLPFFFFSCL